MYKSKLYFLMRPLLAAFFGVMTPLAFAPYAWWPIAILSPYLLLLLLNRQSPRQAFLLSFLWGLGFFGYGINWVHVSIDTFGGVPPIISFLLMATLSAYLALYPALFGGMLNRLFPKQTPSRYLLAVPALWLVTEWLRGWVFTGFPWLWLGYSQIDSPLAGFAPLGGVELITFVIMLLSGSLTYITLVRDWKIALIPLICSVAALSLNHVQWVTPQPQKQTKVALIQGNIDQAIKWLPSQRWPTLTKYTNLTQENWDADLIIWPEAAVPAFEHELTDFFSALDQAARKHHTALITGILNKSPKKNYYNSILTLGNSAQPSYHYDVSQRYHKHHLLPFGEFVPFEKWLRPLAPIFNLPMSSFTAGQYIQPNIMANGRHLVAALCYEIIFGEQVRDNMTDQTDFILTLSNDAWFGHSIGPLQHMEIARMRALELGKPLIRVTNNGVTAVTDSRGHITQQLPQFKTGVLRATLTSTQGKTPYRVWGSWPLYGWTIASLLLAIYLTGRTLTNRRFH
jgi:apolipoprotein N-acyltransferase